MIARILAALLLASLLATAQVVDQRESKLDIQWNPKLPIRGDILRNATIAAKENRYFLANGSIGGLIPSALANATVANVSSTPNITNPVGCQLTLPEKYTVDAFVGEWCYFNEQGGFMFRGVRDPKGILLLQRFRLRVRKPVIQPNVTNSTSNATMGQNVTANATASSNATTQSAPATVSSTAPGSATTKVSLLDESAHDSDNESEEEAEEISLSEQEAEAMFEKAESTPLDSPPSLLEKEDIEEEGYDSFIEVYSALEKQPSMAEIKASIHASLRDNPGAQPLTFLPPLPAVQIGQCAVRAADFVECRSNSLTDVMNGTEATGFCLDDQTSAVQGLELRDFAGRLDRFSQQMLKFAASVNNVALTKSVSNKFNREEDHARFCWLPGTFVEKRRYAVKGNFVSQRIGTSTGMFKPTFSIECGSQFCKTEKIIGAGESSNVFLNFQP